MTWSALAFSAGECTKSAPSPQQFGSPAARHPYFVQDVALTQTDYQPLSDGDGESSSIAPTRLAALLLVRVGMIDGAENDADTCDDQALSEVHGFP